MGVLFTCLIEFFIMTFFNSVFQNESVLAISIFILIFSVFDFIAIEKDIKLSNVKLQILLGLLLRIGLLYFDRYGKKIFVLPNSGADSEGFYRSCVLVATTGCDNIYGAFVGLMSGLMKYVGTSRLLSQYIILKFSLLSIIFISYSIHELDVDYSTESKVMWIISLLPNFAILGVIFLRESIVTLFVSLSCYCLLLWMNNGKIPYFIFSIVFLLLGAQYHSGVIGIAVGYIVVMLLYDNRNKSVRLRLMNIIISIAFVFLFSYLFNNYSDRFFVKLSNVNNIESIANTTIAGGSSYGMYVGDSSSVRNMIIYTPIRLVYFLFSPFPWQWRGITDILAFLFSSCFYLFTVTRAIKKMFFATGETQVTLFLWLIIALSVSFIFAWGVSNTGTATRHRDKLIPIFGIIMALSSNYKWNYDYHDSNSY